MLVKAQPTELVFSVPLSPSQLQLSLRENRSAPSVPLAGEQLVPSFCCGSPRNQKKPFSERKVVVYALIIVCGGFSSEAVQGKEKQAPASGGKPLGTNCKDKSRQTLALLVRVG